MVDSLARIVQQVEAAAEEVGRAPGQVQLIGASKTVTAPALLPFVEGGLCHLGENYIQEGRTKKLQLEELNPEQAARVRWHLIGALQSNKAREAVEQYELIHSVDRPSLARELNKEAGARSKKQRVLLQVNLAGEGSKAGVGPLALPQLVEYCLGLPSLVLCGLMSLPPYRENPEKMRAYHRQLRELLEQCREGYPQVGEEFHELSMGMSNDFRVAIQEGATLVRVGTALFGARS